MQQRTKTNETNGAETLDEAETLSQGDAIGEFESSALIAHIQSATENQKALLARELHDELGGLLVGAVMDLAWAEQHLNAPVVELRQKLMRARQTLATAIDLKRRLIEDLRPTLLDNVGLFAALRWHVQAACSVASIACSISLPDEERRFLPHVPIALFRIVQEAFAVIISQGHPAAAQFTVSATAADLSFEFVCQRIAQDGAANDEIEPHALTAVRYRTNALGGLFAYDAGPALGLRISATFPLEGLLAPV
jgi:signal transduction histidine kinase